MKNVNILIGTKAQFIKVAPLIKELDTRSIPYRLIDTCQHKDITTELRKQFNIRQPDAFLGNNFRNINSLPRALWWTISIFFSLLAKRRAFKQKLFGINNNGLCLIHGDTLSTLMGCIIAKSYGMKAGLLEAGLRSFDIANPFPEELIRLISMKWSDYLFAPSEWAAQNLSLMKVRGEIFTVGDTIVDSISSVLAHSSESAFLNLKPYAVMSIHRFETIYRAKQLKFITELARDIGKQRNIYFIGHQPTLRRLNKNKLINQLDHVGIRRLPILNYSDFISLINNADFVLTDGGSIQEECFYLDIPCLLLRNKTERGYGLGENVCLSKFNRATIERFLANFAEFKRKNPADYNFKPSQRIIEIITALP